MIRLMWQTRVQAVGDVTTILGLAIAVGGLAWESRDRSLRVIDYAAIRLRVRRLLRRPQAAPARGIGAAGTVEAAGHFFGLLQTPVDPAAPVADQIDALNQNLDRVRRHLTEVMDYWRQHDRQYVDKRLAENSERVGELETWRAHQSREEARITTKAMRVELAGLALALVGALLSAIARLI